MHLYTRSNILLAAFATLVGTLTPIPAGSQERPATDHPGATSGAPGFGTASADPVAAAYAGMDEAAIVHIRSDLARAVESMAATLAAIAYIEGRFPGDKTSRSAIVRAYRATLEGLIGKHDPRIFEKLQRITTAIADLAGLVEAHPGSLELRFLRYSLFSQLPGIFGVGKYTKPDLEAILRCLETGSDSFVPAWLELDVIAWLRKSGRLNAASLARLEAAARTVQSRVQ
jgi:hypothetical protein